MILESSSTAINAPEKHLNEIYLTVLRHSISPDYTAEEAEELRYMTQKLAWKHCDSLLPAFYPIFKQTSQHLATGSGSDTG